MHKRISTLYMTLFTKLMIIKKLWTFNKHHEKKKKSNIFILAEMVKDIQIVSSICYFLSDDQ